MANNQQRIKGWAFQWNSSPLRPTKAVSQTGVKPQPKAGGRLSAKRPPVTKAPAVTSTEVVTNTPVDTETEATTNAEMTTNAPVAAEAPLLTGTGKAVLGEWITLDLGRRDNIKVGAIVEVEGPAATELRVATVYPRQCAAVRVRETDPLPAKGDRVHVKSQQQP